VRGSPTELAEDPDDGLGSVLGIVERFGEKPAL
jgi:hypothetical protein